MVRDRTRNVRDFLALWHQRCQRRRQMTTSLRHVNTGNCACVCVSERERERERGRAGAISHDSFPTSSSTGGPHGRPRRLTPLPFTHTHARMNTPTQTNKHTQPERSRPRPVNESSRASESSRSFSSPKHHSWTEKSGRTAPTRTGPDQMPPLSTGRRHFAGVDGVSRTFLDTL